MGDFEPEPDEWGDLAAASLDGVGVLDGARFVYANESFARMFGFEESAAVVGEPWRDRYPPDEQDRLEGEALATARSGGAWQGTAVGQRMDGRRFRQQLSLRETGRGRVLWIVRDIADRGKQDSSLYEAIVENVTDCVYAIDSDLRFIYVNEKLCETFGRSRSELLGTDARTLFSNDDQAEMADDIRERVVAGDTSTGTLRATLPTPDGGRQFEARYCLYPEADGEFRGSVGVIRDVTERVERERQLKRRRDELATLDQINELLLETVGELVDTRSRIAVERTVCERLAASALYEFAWVGERELDGDRVIARTSAGDDNGYLNSITVDTDTDTAGADPIVRAFRTGAVAAASTADGTDSGWRSEAAACGFESVVAVPLHHEDAVYGVLAVYTTRNGAITEREQAGLHALGQVVGLVINAVRNHDLLFADTVVELEFRVGATESVVGRLARSIGGELRLDGYVASGDQWVLYLDVTGVSSDAVVAVAEDDPDIDRSRVLGEGSQQRVELVVVSSSLLHMLTTTGATVRNASATRDAVRFLIEAPGTAEVRGLVELVSASYPDAVLLSKRRRNRDVTSAGRPRGVLEDLTDRQREAVEIAYHAGYYDWPRRSTAEAVASSLNVAPPTLHAHLRKAERAILSSLLDD